MTAASSVTVVPVSSFAVADPLDGTEIVPIVQDATSKQTTAQDIADLVVVPDVDEATVQGRAIGAGTGPVQTLTQTQLTALVIPGSNLVGRLNVPVLAAATRDITATDAGKGLVQQNAAAVTLTIAPDATENLGDGFVTTFACSNAGGSVVIALGAGVTLVDLNDGSSGSKTLTGVGIGTLWRIAANLWGIHGSTNVA